MDEGDRVMMLTPAGVGAIAVVRLTGEAVRRFLQQHFSKPAREGRCVHGNISDGQRVIDDAVVVLLPGGLAADVNLHGGPWVVSSFVELAAREGFELVEQVEEMVKGDSLLEREVMAALPLAKTRQALEILLAQPRAWETYLKDPRQGPSVDQILSDHTLWWLLHPPRVAIVGAANVGKSTLANQLFAQERSITADLPGTTRDWIGEEANLDGLVVTLVDTPGVRQTADPIERLALDQSAGQVQRADLVVLVLDASRELVGVQDRLVAKFNDALRVINKVDRAAEWVNEFPDAIKTVGTTGQGVDELRNAVRRRFGCEQFELGRPRWWTTRQRDALKRGETLI
jgi:small GTP-binding protein